LADAAKAHTPAKDAGEARPADESASGAPPNQAHLRYRPDIDGLRAMAVVPVVLYHSGLGFPGGYVGVDIFFVISGFLITKIIYTLVTERKFSFAEFYDRRIRRLFPALFVMLLAVAAWSVMYLISLDLRDFGASLAAATSYVSNFYFFFVTRGYFHQDVETLPLLHTWSLAVEEQFYIVVPFVVIALAWGTSRRWHVPIIAAVTIASFVLCVWMTQHHAQAAFYLLPARAWELGIGGLLAIGAFESRNRWAREILAFAGLAAILFAIFRFSNRTPFPGWHVAIPTIGTAAILSAGLSGSTVNRLLSTAPFTFIGKISYSFYLWHWPVILAFTYGALAPASIQTSLLCVLVSFVLAVLSWQYVERPFRQRRLLPDARSLFRGAAFASATAVGVGLLFYFSNGLPQRHPAKLVALMEQSEITTAHPECEAVSPVATAKRLCVRGAPGVPPSFVLAGDSHADALSDGLFAAAQKRGVAGVQYTGAGTVPFLLGRSTPEGKARDPLAPAFVAYLRRHPEIQTVIMTAWWVREATGRSYRGELRLAVDEGYDGSGAAYTPIALRHALDRFVKSFPDRRFILLDDIPTGKELDLREYVRVLYASGSAPPSGLPRATADAQRASYEPILKAVAAANRNVSYVPILGRVCGRLTCPMYRPDGLLLYRDGDHLSRATSESLAPALETLFGSRPRDVPRFEAPAPSASRNQGSKNEVGGR
jgi:peptidoglycan/LPS O-acetylase OafA/YrhL